MSPSSTRYCGLGASPFALAAFALVLHGCVVTSSAGGPAPGEGQSALLDKTAIGKNRCPKSKDSASPFVVEWDATDLSSFEAKAGRDVVFVRYEACEIEMLNGCSDASIPGRYGRYHDPSFTSGTVESFRMKDEDEVYARLPLGAAELGGRLQAGDSLELRYFVSGVVTSTRNSIDRVSLAENPRCKSATHFVSSYNLGAFELLAHRQSHGGTQLGFKQVGLHGKSEHLRENVKHGGALDSCDTQTQRHCRVPIRLVLQRIDESKPNLDAVAQGEAARAKAASPPVAVAPPSPRPYEQTPAFKASELRRSAATKEKAGDGVGCLEDIERSMALEDTEISRRQLAYLSALCKMRAGKCDEGRADLAEYLKANDTKRTLKKKQLERQVKAIANSKCPIDQLHGFDDKIMALAVAINAAKERGDAETCVAMAKKGKELRGGVDDKNVVKRNGASGILQRASHCLAELERCKDA